jgi:hypothetical protein
MREKKKNAKLDGCYIHKTKSRVIEKKHRDAQSCPLHLSPPRRNGQKERTTIAKRSSGGQADCLGGKCHTFAVEG